MGTQPELSPFYLPIMPGPYYAGTATRPADARQWVSESPLLSRAEIVSDIWSGQIDPPPARILEIDPAAGTVRDVTKAIAQEVGNRSVDHDPYPDLCDWLDHHRAEYTRADDSDAYDMRREHGTLCRQMQI